MGHLPIPAIMFFKDFASEVFDYNVLDNGIITNTYRGMQNSDEDGNYIGFLMSDKPQIFIGNTICTTDGLESFNIRQISYDRYNGNPELLKAYY